jgi:D-serine dehydratase
MHEGFEEEGITKLERKIAVLQKEVRQEKHVIELKDSELVELQERNNRRNDLIEKNCTLIAKKDKIIAQNNVQTTELENLQNKYEQEIVAKKYLIKENHYIWD